MQCILLPFRRGLVKAKLALNVRKIAINRVTDERAENNWSMCVIRGRCRCQHAARAALIRLDRRLAETALLLGALSEDTRHRPRLAKLLLESWRRAATAPMNAVQSSPAVWLQCDTEPMRRISYVGVVTIAI